MLLSMTGHGESRLHEAGLTVAVELRTVNSRFLKIALRTSDGHNAIEPQIEALLRAKLRRGTIQASVRIDRARPLDDYQVNTSVLDGYRRQLEALHLQWGIPGAVPLESLLTLPGVVDANADRTGDAMAEWPTVARALDEAIANLDQMRAEEGRAMAADLHSNCRVVAESLRQVKERLPAVVEGYRKRLQQRVQEAMQEYQVSLDPADLVREVALFVERSDISEEIVRLESHLEQFDAISSLPESSGRKLAFLIQEMHREANTLGSKSYDVVIARLVVDVKTAIERLREVVQNVE